MGREEGGDQSDLHFWYTSQEVGGSEIGLLEDGGENDIKELPQMKIKISKILKDIFCDACKSC